MFTSFDDSGRPGLDWLQPSLEKASQLDDSAVNAFFGEGARTILSRLRRIAANLAQGSSYDPRNDPMSMVPAEIANRIAPELKFFDASIFLQ